LKAIKRNSNYDKELPGFRKVPMYVKSKRLAINKILKNSELNKVLEPNNNIATRKLNIVNNEAILDSRRDASYRLMDSTNSRNLNPSKSAIFLT
jgi:hypothetical protein